ncbi:MAG: hypothetical protein IPP15_16720 [Saprospiraceae bacterium]|uniref:Uncharacterized protein n=1 Tax=Candidatus Opimibacter skivensis TaxID=2982028 RepID=A0A9D7SXI3_9BACT|nr:hypothetical protein [Candidatus Opimibacter skivensis]
MQSKKWIDLPVLPVPVSFGSGVVLDHALFVLGGIDTLLQFTDAFQKFDLFQNKWSTLPDPNCSKEAAWPSFARKNISDRRTRRP